MYSNITSTGSQVTLGFPHSQIRLRVASPKVREHGHTTPVAYELASDTCYGLGVVTLCLACRHFRAPLRHRRGPRLCINGGGIKGAVGGPVLAVLFE